MPILKGSVKGVIAVASGYVAQTSGQIPSHVLCGPLAELGPYLGFVVGTFLGLVVADVLSGDVTPGRPALGFTKGLSAALGAAFPLVVLTDLEPLIVLCNGPVGEFVEQFVGDGLCYPYSKMVVGTFVGVLLGDLMHAPFRG